MSLPRSPSSRPPAGGRRPRRPVSALTVPALLRRLQALTPALAAGHCDLTAELGPLRLVEASLRPYLRWRPGAYTRQRVYRCDAFELMVLCWDCGSRSPIHGHGGQSCWLYVHRGCLHMQAYGLEDRGQAGRAGADIGVRRQPGALSLGPGVADLRGPHDDLHAVSNPRSAGTRAVSVHVYARPFDSCLVYRPRARRAELRPVRYG